jgi:flagellar capping protein FliD
MASASLNAFPGTFNVEVENIAKVHRVKSEKQVSITDELGLSGTFQINNKEISINSSDNLNDITRKINESNSGARAVIINNTLSIESTKTGSTNLLNFSNDSSNVLETLGVLNSEKNIKFVTQDGEDLIAKINGIEFVSESNNTEISQGVKIDVKSVGESVVNIGLDKDSIVSEMKNFVDQINDLLTYVKQETSVELGSSGNIANVGKLNGVSTKLTNLESNIRSMLNDFDVKELGLEFVGGKVTLDEEKLMQNLTVNPEKTQKVLAGREALDGKDGVIREIDSFIQNNFLDPQTGLIEVQQNNLQASINLDFRYLDDNERQALAYEEMLYVQFATMEQMISKYTSQMDYLSSLLPKNK